MLNDDPLSDYSDSDNSVESDSIMVEALLSDDTLRNDVPAETKLRRLSRITGKVEFPFGIKIMLSQQAR